MWVRIARPALVMLAGCGLMWGQIPGIFRHKQSDFRSWGRIIAFHLEVPLATPPLASLDQFPLKHFTYPLYPTASSGEDGMVPGNTVTGEPLQLPVVDGIYDHHNDATSPMQFQIIKADAASLPKAPDGQALLIYGVLYTGDQSANCTGLLDVVELKDGHAQLTDQISWDCRGGASATWNADKRQLTVTSARYSLGDQPCCPSRYDSVVFKLDGAAIKTSDITVYDQ